VSYSKFATVTLADRAATHERIAAEKADAMERRRVLAREYLADHRADLTIPFERAVAVADLVDETAAAREESIALNQGRATEVNNGALEFPVLGHEFAADGPVLELATSPLIMAPVIEYFGMVPILFNVVVTRAHTTELLRNTAHLFHLDPEDTISFKVFVHLTDVDAECGPLHVLPADLTDKVFETVEYRGVSRLEDDEIADLVGWDNVVEVLGPAGTTAFADTTRCLHFGGRPRSEGKPLREMLLYQYLLPTSVLLNGERSVPAQHFLPQMHATGDEVRDALLGAVLT